MLGSVQPWIYPNQPVVMLSMGLVFTRHRYYQYCMAYGIHMGGRKGSRILSNNRVIVLHQGGQCRRAGGKKGCLIRAQRPRSKRMSCKGRLTRSLLDNG